MFTSVTKSRGLDGERIKHSLEPVQYKRGKGLAVYVLGDDNELFLAALSNFFQQWQNILDTRNLLICHQNKGLLIASFHPGHIGHHIGAHVTAVDFKAFHNFLLQAQRLALLHGHSTVITDGFYHVRNQLANF